MGEERRESVRRGRWEREEKRRAGRAGEKASALSLLVRSIERLDARCPAALAKVAERTSKGDLEAEKVERAKTRGGGASAIRPTARVENAIAACSSRREL